MELELYNDAMKGNIEAFKGKGDQIESILTPNKNTILHVHFTNYAESVSETFVEEVLGICPTLILKTNVKDETILHIAARYGHQKLVKKLIDCAKVLPRNSSGVGVEKRLIRAINDKKDTALHEAARYGHTEVVEVLMKEEPDHSYFGKNVADETPLYIAVERQYWNVVDTVLDICNSPQYHGPNGRTALHAAVLHGDKDKVSKLLTRNLSAAKEADENGWVPLHLAALGNDLSMIGVLLRNDRSTAYLRDNKGRTALHFAGLWGASSVMKKILEYCPDCYELVDEKGSNALHYTAMGECNYLWCGLKQIVKDAPQITNMCNEKDEDGNTPLHILAHHALQWNYNANSLLEPQFPRVDTMACNKYGQTALDVAVDDVPSDLVYQNTMLWRLQDIGAKLGGRVLDKRLTQKKEEKRIDSAVDEKYKTHGQDNFAGVATTLSVVAILIATVTFAGGFTLPGGMIQAGEHEGSPILKYNASFIAFVLTDSLSFVLSTSAVFALFVSSTATNAKPLYELLLMKCAVLTLAAMGFMIIAFGTGIYAVLGVSKGFGVVTLLIILSFFFIIFINKRVKVRSYVRNYSLHRVRDIQLSYTL